MQTNGKVADAFRKREEKILNLILESGLPYQEIGIFGSYARGDYNAMSDIDFCVIVEEHPDRVFSGLLRTEAEEMGADIVYVRPDYFKEDESAFAKELRRDYKRLVP